MARKSIPRMRRVLTATEAQKYRRRIPMIHNCRVCEVELDDDNWYLSNQKCRNYICKECVLKNQRLYREANRDKVNAASRLYCENNPEKAKAKWTRAQRKKGQLPMSKNKECSSYFGVHINERLLKHCFNDVEVMPYGNKGYDFICNKGMKVDSKSSCLTKKGGWSFNIRRNTIADYFLLVAYDNRKDLNPVHIWLLPGDKVNHLTGVSISISNIHKWDEYEQDIDELISCCDTMKGEHNDAEKE